MSPSYRWQLNESIFIILTSFLQALNYHPEGRRRVGYSWKPAAKTLAKNRVGWRVLVDALSSPGCAKGLMMMNFISMFIREFI